MTIYLIIRPEEIGENIKKIEAYLSDKDYSKRFVIGNKEFKELGQKPPAEMSILIRKEKKVEIMGYGNKEDIGKIMKKHPYTPKLVIIKDKLCFK